MILGHYQYINDYTHAQLQRSYFYKFFERYLKKILKRTVCVCGKNYNIEYMIYEEL